MFARKGFRKQGSKLGDNCLDMNESIAAHNAKHGGLEKRVHCCGTFSSIYSPPVSGCSVCSLTRVKRLLALRRSCCEMILKPDLIVGMATTENDDDDLLREVETLGIADNNGPSSSATIDSSEVTAVGNVNNNDSAKAANTSMQTRRSNWVNVLGVRNKPDQLVDWDHLYNLADQAELRKHCQHVIEKVNSKTLSITNRMTLPALESMLTLWCKKRKIDRVSNFSWENMMSVLIEMDFNHSTLFNVFYAITTKYIPREVEEGGKTYDLFRLIMQYHDPEICSHLDSLKVTPYTFAASWFRSLFSEDVSSELCIQLWDIYFDRADPFLVFFIALCLVESARDQLLAKKNKDEIVNFIKDLPKHMSVDDIQDLVDVCAVTVGLTPVSVREDFHCMLFGANMVEDYYELPLEKLLCLPISVQELYKRVIDVNGNATIPYNYFVIDTRASKDFNQGSVQGSYNLSGHLLVDEPEKFQNAMTALIRFKEKSYPSDHICFFGSGLEEDDAYMVMVISRFLHKNITHISYVDGGYKALHTMLKDTNNLDKLSNHCISNNCIHCNTDIQTTESFAWSFFSRIKQHRKDLKDAAKNITELLPKRDFFGGGNSIQHVRSDDRNQKRYRNTQSVFTIDDSDDSDVEPSTDVEQVYANEKLKWDEIVKQPEITHHFTGHEVLPERTLVPCYIALSRTHMHIFHDNKDVKDCIRSHARHPLSTVMRVSSKKRHPEYLTFQYGYELPTGEAHINRVHKFLIEKSGELATAVKGNIHSLMPNLLG
uniref:TBC1 domain family member 23 n=1 Tax=Panagrellus redivivus TaxID=6233 RepID=A0A7E4ZZ16_PANRE